MPMVSLPTQKNGSKAYQMIHDFPRFRVMDCRDQGNGDIAQPPNTQKLTL